MDDLAGVARAIIDGNSYLTLATADADGRPWASPVWFAPDGYDVFLWVSAQDTGTPASSPRSDVGIVIFDSTAPIGTGQAVDVGRQTAARPEPAPALAQRGIERFSQRSLALRAAATGPLDEAARRPAPLRLVPRHGDRALDPRQGRRSRRRSARAITASPCDPCA